MNKKIFMSSFFTAFTVLIITIIMLMGILFNFFEKQIETELKSEASYISQALKTEGLSYFNDFKKDSKRITVIDFDGNVLYDTQAEKDGFDNHLNREEIKQALITGTGMSSRYSDTFAEKTVYYAVRLENIILRVSQRQYTVVTIILNLVPPIIIVLIFALLICLLLSSKVSKAIIRPINNLDLEHPENNEIYEELTPLLKKVAEQKRTIKNQLAEADKKREEFNLITENMSEGFLLIDKNTNLLTYNSAALRLLGIEKANEASVLSLCRAKGFREVISTALDGNSTHHTLAKDERLYNLIANPVPENGAVIGAVIIIIDITESEKRDILRREFTANVSHELKTPLTSISGFAELMTNGSTPDETVKDFSKSIYDEAQRLISLVNDIIKLSELDEGNIPFESETVDLYELSKNIIERLSGEAKKRNINISLSGSCAKILGIPKILDEMIYNLCDNAIKYNKENGSVEIILNHTDTTVEITVKDTGTGIPPAEQQRVFERFYRVDKSHSKKNGGTGLGLAIVKHGAIYHNAEITLTSAEGKGTSITITFPLK